MGKVKIADMTPEQVKIIRDQNEKRVSIIALISREKKLLMAIIRAYERIVNANLEISDIKREKKILKEEIDKLGEKFDSIKDSVETKEKE